MVYTRLYLCPDVVLCGGGLAAAVPSTQRTEAISFSIYIRTHAYIIHYT